jgi:hypothetical protein
MLKVLEEDFARLPGLLGTAPPPPAAAEPAPDVAELLGTPEPAVQLGLF